MKSKKKTTRNKRKLNNHSGGQRWKSRKTERGLCGQATRAKGGERPLKLANGRCDHYDHRSRGGQEQPARANTPGLDRRLARWRAPGMFHDLLRETREPREPPKNGAQIAPRSFTSDAAHRSSARQLASRCFGKSKTPPTARWLANQRARARSSCGCA